MSCCHTGLGIRFSNGFWYRCMPCKFLEGVLGNRGPLKDTRRLPRVRLSTQGVTIILVSELTVFNVFLPFLYEYSGYRLLISWIVSCNFDSKQLSFFIDVMPPRSESSRPRKIPVEEEAASAPLTHPSQVESQACSEYPVPLIPQPSFFPPMTLEACLAYANFWYAQAQVQALVRQGQYPMSPLSTVAQPRAQPFRFGMSPPDSTRKSRIITKKCLIVDNFI